MERLIRLYNAYGLAGICGVIGLVEAGVLFFLPDEGLLIYLGFLIRRGEQRLGPVLVGVTLGVLGGASLLYWVVRRKGHPLLVRYGSTIGLDGERLERAELSLRRWGDWAILAGRLVPGLRLTLTATLGLLEFPFGRFVALLGISVPLWAGFYIGIGYYLGERAMRDGSAVARALHFVERHTLATLVASLAVTIVVVGVRVWLARQRAER